MKTVILCIRNDSDTVLTSVSWCFKPRQSQGITSGLREEFIKRCIFERTNKAELGPAEQSEKAESCRKNLWNEVQLQGP